MHYTSDELGLATRWFYNLTDNIARRHIRLAMRNLDALKLDSAQVLIAAYRLHTRTIENSIPWPRQ